MNSSGGQSGGGETGFFSFEIDVVEFSNRGVLTFRNNVEGASPVKIRIL